MCGSLQPSYLFTASRFAWDANWKHGDIWTTGEAERGGSCYELVTFIVRLKHTKNSQPMTTSSILLLLTQTKLYSFSLSKVTIIPLRKPWNLLQKKAEETNSGQTASAWANILAIRMLLITMSTRKGSLRRTMGGNTDHKIHTQRPVRENRQPRNGCTRSDMRARA